ncbi:trichohyalin-like [Sardina pilchardus]|uniref:trichohyalin-like n=1 Tax=Sardina pilchardus TaxID=27697 RepID=UPI002E167162
MMTLPKQEEWQHYLDCLVHTQLRDMEGRLQHRMAMVLSQTQPLETEGGYREASQHRTFDHLMDQQDSRAVMRRMRKARGEQPNQQSAMKSHSGQETQRGRGQERKLRTLPGGKEQGTSQDKVFYGSKKEHSESDWKTWLRQRLFGTHTEVKQDNINKTVKRDRQHREGERGRVEGFSRNKDREERPKRCRNVKCARADQSNREYETREREEQECHKDKQKKREDHIRKGEMEKEKQIEMEKQREKEELDKLYAYIEKLREEIRLLELEKNMEKLRGEVRLLEVKVTKGKNQIINRKECGYKRGINSMEEGKRQRDNRQESAKGKEMEAQELTETSMANKKSLADMTKCELVVKEVQAQAGGLSRKVLIKEQDDNNGNIWDSEEDQNSDQIKHQFRKSVSEGNDDSEIEVEDETEKVGRKEKTRNSECGKSAEQKDRSKYPGKLSGGHGDTNFNNELRRKALKEQEHNISEDGMKGARGQMTKNTEAESYGLWNLDFWNLVKDIEAQWKGPISEEDSDSSWGRDFDEENTRVTDTDQQKDQDSDTDSLWDTDSYNEMNSNGQTGEQKQTAFDSDSSCDFYQFQGGTWLSF